MNSSMSYPCDPSLVPSRKGGFDILGALEILPGMLNSCIQAHPPSRVRRKVYEFSGLVPDTLKFELVPRGEYLECAGGYASVIYYERRRELDFAGYDLAFRI
ncbi:hypothetical protein KY290_030134 [Solanum tuberosum]|uniref:AIPP2-like SPOC-like domain-containing protein n=1 Tax=Solanum tuberosum TaxID=4113 RepID=A0ABQ7UMQ0_SOLTU|nr:hypothetical protein KY290_030134 [Solanum tuberosum]